MQFQVTSSKIILDLSLKRFFGKSVRLSLIRGRMYLLYHFVFHFGLKSRKRYLKIRFRSFRLFSTSCNIGRYVKWFAHLWNHSFMSLLDMLLMWLGATAFVSQPLTVATGTSATTTTATATSGVSAVSDDSAIRIQLPNSSQPGTRIVVGPGVSTVI